jgi:hypothetical protein
MYSDNLRLALRFIQRKFVSVVSPVFPISQNYFPTYNLLSHVVFYLLVFRRKRRILSSFAPVLVCYPRQWTRMTNTCFMYNEAIFLLWVLNTFGHVSNFCEYWTQVAMCQIAVSIEHSWTCVSFLYVLHTIGHVLICCVSCIQLAMYQFVVSMNIIGYVSVCYKFLIHLGVG